MDINLDTSDWRLWVMCLVIVGCLAFWLVAVFRAARNPHQGGRHRAEQRQPGPSVPRPAREQDTSVRMPAQRPEPASPADQTRGANH
jgi:hypothetical protein